MNLETLQQGEIRLLESLNVTDGQVHCRLRHALLDTFQGVTRTDDVWPELQTVHYDYSKLFANSWSVFDNGYRKFCQRSKAEFYLHIGKNVPKQERSDLSNYYVALSYVWGASKQGHSIIVDGHPLPVTDNLFAVMEKLSDTNAVRNGAKVWVDAICINQDDLAERAQQVGVIQEIYASAWQVVIWLGLAMKYSESAFTAVRWIAEEGYKDPDVPPLKEMLVEGPAFQVTRPACQLLRQDVYNGLWHLFSQPYWHRLWILQEVATAKSCAPIQWGSFCVSLEDLKLQRDISRPMNVGLA